MIRSPVPAECQAVDGVTLRGLKWDGDSGWLLLVHDSDEDSDLDGWRPLVPGLMATDWSVLAIDLHGHGASDGNSDERSIAIDLDAWAAYVRVNGAEWIAVISTGRSATEVLEWASTTALGALVLLSPQGLDEKPGRNLRGAGEAKLFAVGSFDEVLGGQVSQARNRSIGWAMVVGVPTTRQGIALLTGELAPHVKERIVAFLREQRFLSRNHAKQADQLLDQSMES